MSRTVLKHGVQTLNFGLDLQSVDALLKQMSGALLKYSDQPLVQSCAESLRYLRSSDIIAQRVDAVVATTCEELEARLDETTSKVGLRRRGC